MDIVGMDVQLDPSHHLLRCHTCKQAHAYARGSEILGIETSNGAADNRKALGIFHDEAKCKRNTTR
jgi:hypothetical protein